MRGLFGGSKTTVFIAYLFVAFSRKILLKLGRVTLSISDRLQEFNVRWEACIRKSTLRTLEENRRKLGEPELTVEQRKLLWAYGEPRNLKEALKSLSVVYSMVLLQEDVFAITADIVDRYNADNVVYLELRVKPCISKELSPETFLRKVIQAIIAAKVKYPSMTVKVLVTIELERSIENVREAIDLVMILGRTRRSKNLPDSEVINGIEIVGDPNETDMRQVHELLNKVREESELVIVFNLAQVDIHSFLTGIHDGFDHLYDLLTFRPDRLSNAEILTDFRRNRNEINHRVLIDRLLSMKLPIDFSYTANRINCSKYDDCLIWRNHLCYLSSVGHPILLSTGYGELLGRSLSDEYYQLAVHMDLTPIDVFILARTASFFTEKTPRNKRCEFFPFTEQYDAFASEYGLNNSDEWKLQFLRHCQFFLSRPLTPRRKQRRRRIIDILYQ
uniref:Adenosine deaminase domain-containing protein n=1 Tax=Setaria digitata TaxID=48799 RepID=A0A915PMQ2_9BILA